MKTKEATDEITPLQRARMRAAAVAVQQGRVDFPLRCGHCKGTYVTESLDKAGDGGSILECLSCGRRTLAATAKRLRKQSIRAYIERGIDL